MIKIGEHLESHKKFLNQIRRLLIEFDIETNEIKSDKPRKDRKDKKLSPLFTFVFIEIN